VKSFKNTFAGLVLGCSAALAATPALAGDEFPNKPLRLVVPFAAGSGTDAVARLTALNGHISAQVVEGGHCFMQEFPQVSAERTAEFLLRSA